MKLLFCVALGAAPGCTVLALTTIGVRVAPGWYHPVALFADFYTMVAVGVGLIVWAVDTLVASPRTARLRVLLACACAFSAGLLCTATLMAYSDRLYDAVALLAFLPYPVLVGAVLVRTKRSAPPV